VCFIDFNLLVTGVNGKMSLIIFFYGAAVRRALPKDE